MTPDEIRKAMDDMRRLRRELTDALRVIREALDVVTERDQVMAQLGAIAALVHLQKRGLVSESVELKTVVDPDRAVHVVHPAIETPWRQ